MDRFRYNPSVVRALTGWYARQALHEHDPDFIPFRERWQDCWDGLERTWYEFRFARQGAGKRGPMRKLIIGQIILALVTGNLVAGPRIAKAAAQTPANPSSISTTVTDGMYFEPNVGQSDPQVRFLARSGNTTVFLTGTQMVIEVAKVTQTADPLGKRVISVDSITAVSMSLPGGGPSTTITGSNPAPGYVNYLEGSDRSKWRTGIPIYRSVTYTNVYPSTNLVVDTSTGNPEYTFELAAGADPNVIGMDINGASSVSISPGGDMELDTPSGKIVEKKPHAYQSVDGAQHDVPSSFSLNNTHFGFALGSYRNDLPLTIDPSVVYGTLLGGPGGSTEATGITHDSSGNAYVNGVTNSPSFPVAPGPQPVGSPMEFVTKLNPSGSGLVYSTVFGPIATVQSTGQIAVDAQGDAFVDGAAGPGFPTTPGSFEPTPTSNIEAFAVKLDPSGTSLAYSTFLGANSNAFAIAVGSDGSVFTAGSAQCGGHFPIIAAAQPSCPTPAPSNCGYADHLNASGSGLIFSTFICGSQGTGGFNTTPDAIASDSSLNAYVVGTTGSPDLPTLNAFQPAPRGTLRQAFFEKLSGSGTLQYASYLGGSRDNLGNAVAVDPIGRPHIAGTTCSSDFPVKNAYQGTLKGFCDQFLTVLSSDGRSEIFSTLLSGSLGSTGFGVAVDSAGESFVTSLAASKDFPLISDLGITTSLLPGTLAKFDSFGALKFSSFIGGVIAEVVSADDAGNAYLTGIVGEFTPTPGAFLTTFPGFPGNFVAPASFAMKISTTGPPPPPPPPPTPHPTPPQMAGGSNPSNSHTNQTQGCAIRPVNTESGALWHTCTDFAIPGRGIPLDLTRTYNSIFSTQDSPGGFGWTCSYCMSLSRDPISGNVTINQENGSQVNFQPSGSTFTADPWVIATLAHNTDGSWTFVRENQLTFTFDSLGRLISEQDLNGYKTQLAYSTAGQLASVTDPAGRALAFAFSGSRIASIADPASRVVHLNYDAAGNLANYVDVQGNTTSFTYSPSHLMLTITDPNGGVTANVYDAQNRVISQTDPMNRTTTLVYAGDPETSVGGTTTITDPRGNVTQETYQNGLRSQITSGFGTPQAATAKVHFDPNTLGVTSVTDPNGNSSAATYDASGNLLTAVDQLGRHTSNTYNQINEVLTSIDGNGITTTFAYDGHGNLLSVSKPLTQSSQTQTTQFQYQDANHPGEIMGVVDPNGNTWRYSYDQFGSLITATDPLGNESSATFNNIGFKLSSTTPKGNLPTPTAGDQQGHHEGDNPTANFTTTFAYNNYGDLLSTTDPLGHKTSGIYDSNRNVIQAVDAVGNVTKNVFDHDNELVQVNRADGTVTRTTYNSDGTIAAQIDGAGNATTYSYDPLARTTSAADPLGRAAGYSYDGNGNLLTKTDAMNQVTSYAYDKANQLLSVSYSDGHTPNVTGLSYDNNGNRLVMTDGTGTSSYTFDSLNRLTQSKDGSGATVGYSYDLNGNLTQLTYPSGNKVTRSFDANSRVSAISDWLGNTTTFSYDANSNLVKTTLPASTKEVDTQTLDAADNLISMLNKRGNETLASFSYVRDANNQVTRETDHFGGSQAEGDQASGDGQSQGNGQDGQGSKTYTYTPLNQLAKVNDSSYKYSSADNLIRLINGTTQTFDPANQLLSAVTKGGQTTAYSYSQNGNRISSSSPDKATTLGYDQANRLVSFSSVSTKDQGERGESKTNTVAASYSYNGDGLRMSKTVAGGRAQPFVWDVAEGLSLLLSDAQNQYIYGPGGLALEQISSAGQVNFLHHDQLGSTRLVTDSKGHMDGAFTFDPYGNLTDTRGDTQTQLLFSGQYFDRESALYYLRARSYDPATDQFVSVDPLVATTGQSYSYGLGSPLSITDPTGAGCSPAPWDWGTCLSQLGSWLGVANQNVGQFVSNNSGLIRVISGVASIVSGISGLVAIACAAVAWLAALIGEAACVYLQGISFATQGLALVADVSLVAYAHGSLGDVALDVLGFIPGVAAGRLFSKAADLAYLAKVVGIGRQGMSAAARFLRLVSSRYRAAGYLARAIDAVNSAIDVIAGVNKLLSSQCP